MGTTQQTFHFDPKILSRRTLTPVLTLYRPLPHRTLYQKGHPHHSFARRQRLSDHLLPLSVGAPFAHRLRHRSSSPPPRSMHTDLIADSGRASSATDCSVEVVEIESGVPEIKGHLAKGFSK